MTTAFDHRSISRRALAPGFLAPRRMNVRTEPDASAWRLMGGTLNED